MGSDMQAKVKNKHQKLKDLIQSLESVVVAYSGGIDSTLVLKVAHDTLGDRAIGLTAASASVPQSELAEAEEIARNIGARHIVIQGRETSDPRYLENTTNRCYFCKNLTYEDILAYAQEYGFTYVLDGTNADDVDDHRPGRVAAREHGVRSPLQEVGITKSEIRALAQELGLPNWNKPAAACLSSRIPYGTLINIEVLSRIERAEASLKAMGFSQLRVRHHDQVARIEVPVEEFDAVLHKREAIIASFKEIGYHYITLDIAGFRSGSMNEVI